MKRIFIFILTFYPFYITASSNIVEKANELIMRILPTKRSNIIVSSGIKPILNLLNVISKKKKLSNDIITEELFKKIFKIQYKGSVRGLRVYSIVVQPDNIRRSIRDKISFFTIKFKIKTSMKISRISDRLAKLATKSLIQKKFCYYERIQPKDLGYKNIDSIISTIALTNGFYTIFTITNAGLYSIKNDISSNFNIMSRGNILPSYNIGDNIVFFSEESTCYVKDKKNQNTVFLNAIPKGFFYPQKAKRIVSIQNKDRHFSNQYNVQGNDPEIWYEKEVSNGGIITNVLEFLPYYKAKYDVRIIVYGRGKGVSSKLSLLFNGKEVVKEFQVKNNKKSIIKFSTKKLKAINIIEFKFKSNFSILFDKIIVIGPFHVESWIRLNGEYINHKIIKIPIEKNTEPYVFRVYENKERNNQVELLKCKKIGLFKKYLVFNPFTGLDTLKSDYLSFYFNDIKKLKQIYNGEINRKILNIRERNIIIYHPIFQEFAKVFQNTVRSIDAVSVSDIYNLFSFGEPKAEAIKKYIKYIFLKFHKLETIILVGDANIDSDNKSGNNIPDYIPTIYLWTASSGSTAADQLYGDITDDYLPDIIVTRIPLSSVSDGSNYIEKLKTYKKNNRVILAADKGFDRYLDNLAKDYGFKSVKKVYLKDFQEKPNPNLPGRMMNPDATDALISAINNGAGLIIYQGHGGVGVWSKNRFFLYADVYNKLNNSIYPFIFDGTCLTGYFDRFDKPWDTCLAEHLLFKKKGGSVASISPTRKGNITGNNELIKAFFSIIKRYNNLNLGEIYLLSKIIYIEKNGLLSEYLMYNYFGSPFIIPGEYLKRQK